MSEHHPIKMLSSPVGLSLSNQNLKRVSFSDVSPPITPKKGTSPRSALQHTHSELRLINRLHAMDQELEHDEASTEYTSATEVNDSTASKPQDADPSSITHVNNKQTSVESSTDSAEIVTDNITQINRLLEHSPIIEVNGEIATSDYITVINKRSTVNNKATLNRNLDCVPRSEANKNAFDVLLDYGSIDSTNEDDVTINADVALDSQEAVSSLGSEIDNDISDTLPESGSTENMNEHVVIANDEEVSNTLDIVPSPGSEVDNDFSEALPYYTSNGTINDRDTPYSDVAPNTKDILPSLRSEVDIEYSKFVETVSEVTAAIDAALSVQTVASPTTEDIIYLPENLADLDATEKTEQTTTASAGGVDRLTASLSAIDNDIVDDSSSSLDSAVVELIPELASLTLKETPLSTDETIIGKLDNSPDSHFAEQTTNLKISAHEVTLNDSSEASSLINKIDMEIDKSHSPDSIGGTIDRTSPSLETALATNKKSSFKMEADEMNSSDSFLNEVLYGTTADAVYSLNATETLKSHPLPSSSSPAIGIGIPFGTALVDLYIGPTLTHYKIHKDLLCQIPYFSVMFNNGNFQESHDQSARFPSDFPETFALFLEWLYSKRCDSISGGAKKSSGTKVKDMDILKLYVLGQMMFLPLLQDCAISLMLDHYQQSRTYPGLAMMAYIYENTPEGSGARKFIAETVHCIMKRPFQDIDHELNLRALSGLMAGNKELLFDVMVLNGGAKERDWFHGAVRESYDLRRCLFHEHGKGKGEERGCLYR